MQKKVFKYDFLLLLIIYKQNKIIYAKAYNMKSNFFIFNYKMNFRIKGTRIIVTI